MEAAGLVGYTELYSDHEDSYIRLRRDVRSGIPDRPSELGMSRSEFFTRAAQRYLDELAAQSLTGQIDSALERLDGTDEAEAAAVAIGHRVLDAADDEW